MPGPLPAITLKVEIEMITQAIPLPRTTIEPRSRTLIMGVINTTPDSFSDGGKLLDPDVAVKAGMEMLEAGADILDVGGESTRPGSLGTAPEEESRRTVPVIRELNRQAPDAVISIDTRRSVVAEAALEAGAQIINDVSGFRDDPGLVDLARESGAATIIMHMLGTPKDMQKDIHYDDCPGDIIAFLRDRVKTLEESGIEGDKIIIDPGIGFGKTFDHNLRIINNLHLFKELANPLMVGPSRKAFLGKILDEPDPSARDQGTMAVITAAIMRGADIVRVHNVPPAVQACRVADAVIREKVSA
ncbi:dihydropteroate synthase [Thermodesulfobacteriota bacterium]